MMIFQKRNDFHFHVVFHMVSRTHFSLKYFNDLFFYLEHRIKDKDFDIRDGTGSVRDFQKFNRFGSVRFEEKKVHYIICYRCFIIKMKGNLIRYKVDEVILAHFSYYLRFLF